MRKKKARWALVTAPIRVTHPCDASVGHGAVHERACIYSFVSFAHVSSLCRGAGSAGSYLVRRSDGLVVVSTVNERRGVLHYRLEQAADGSVHVLDIATPQTFATLQAFLAHCLVAPDAGGLAVRLTACLAAPEQKIL